MHFKDQNVIHIVPVEHRMLTFRVQTIMLKEYAAKALSSVRSFSSRLNYDLYL